MITQLHILTTYMCTMACEHCFVCSSPWAEGTFTPSLIAEVLRQAKELGTVDRIYFEGGEPFLFYPVLLDGIRQAGSKGFSVGIVTNGYFATSEENARFFLEPFAGLGIKDLSISDDVFHYENRNENAARRAFHAAKEMGMPAAVLALEPGGSGPGREGSPREDEKKGVIEGGGIMFRGRAAEKLSKYATANDWQTFKECPYEDLTNPSRLHVDAFGNLQICQGISLGNIWKHSLKELVMGYSPSAHPICGPLVEGGPARLARDLGFAPPPGVADACHLCYIARKSCREKYPGILEPEQVYCTGE